MCIGLATLGELKSITIFFGESARATPRRSSFRSAAVCSATASASEGEIYEAGAGDRRWIAQFRGAQTSKIFCASARGFSPRCFARMSAALVW